MVNLLRHLRKSAISLKRLELSLRMAFDDYLWREHSPHGDDLLRCPKPGIDAFTNLYFHKLRILSAPLRQLYVQKTSE
jgi:hypothetical protein